MSSIEKQKERVEEEVPLMSEPKKKRQLTEKQLANLAKGRERLAERKREMNAE